VTAASFALFTDKVHMTNHLQAGTLDISLKRTYLSWTGLDEDGYPEVDDSNEVVPFSGDTQRNVFDWSSSTRFAPGCQYEATMEIASAGNVAFGWYIEIKLADGTAANNFSNQIYVYVTTKNEQGQDVVVKKQLSQGNVVGSVEAPIGKLGPNDTAQTFKVKIAFESDTNDNDAQGLQTSFDLIVYATQLTA
jgi:hypothetical protein